MRLRDRLVGLSPPSARDAIAQTGIAHKAETYVEGRALDALQQLEAERTQRIARLRALIGEVEIRTRSERGHAPVRASDAVHNAPGFAGALHRAPGIAGALHRAPGIAGALHRAPGIAGASGALPFGALRETAAGALHVVERHLEPRHQHGRVVVRDALRATPALLGQLALDPALASLDLSRMLILDTETTGLAGGAGTVPFLIGLAWFEDGALKVEQLFLREFGAEAPLLHYVAERIRAASCLVSYNGKAFDWPLLRARFVLNRVPMPEPPPHLDLLHCARRIWKARLGSVRLPEVERALLGYYREDDIDGAMIPGLYLGYLRGADPRTLLPVFTHNEQDLVALAAILWRLCEHFEEVRPADDARDHLAYARVALRAGDVERARTFAEAAAAGSESAELAALAHGVCASVARRSGDVQATLSCWQRALAACAEPSSAARIHLALTRLYERQLRDLPRAQHHARFTLACEGDEAHARRLRRLQRRLERLERMAQARGTA